MTVFCLPWIQNYCALKNQCDLILTRNIKDYTFSELHVLESGEFIALYDK